MIHLLFKKKGVLMASIKLILISLCLITTQLQANPITQQSRRITGTVTDAKGEALVGVNVVVLGTTNGSITDHNGNYSIENVSPDATLIISYIGFLSQEIKVDERTSIHVTLEEDTLKLDEVVVTALGIRREKKALGYAIQEVKTDNLTENKSVSIANMLQGKIAGVQISQSGTGIGGSTRVILRGINSFSGKNQPLWVVDGIPINDGTRQTAGQWGGLDASGSASQINPENIESISVLKGANAAALYGSRAQSGAIIITTKTGKQGQPLEIEYNGNLMVSTIYNPYSYQNTYGQGSGGTFTTSAKGSWGPKMDGQMVAHWKNAIYGDASYGEYAFLPQKDQIEEFYDTGSLFSNTLTATAGSDRMTGRLSFTDSRNNGVTPNHSINRQYFDLNTEFTEKYLTVSANINYMREKVNNTPEQGEYSLMNQFVFMPRSIRLSDLATNNINEAGSVTNWSGASSIYTNPYGLVMGENGNTNFRNRIIGQIRATVRFTDYLSLTGRVGIDWFNDLYKKFMLHPADGFNTTTQYTKSQSNNQEFNADLILNFNKTFGDFSVSANVGTSVYNVKSEGLSGSAGLFQIPNYVYMANGTQKLASESYSKKEIQSVLGSASLGYRNMAYLSATGRNDWSSTLPSTNWSYFYPSVSLSGIVSEMMELPEIIDYLKVRGSWAQVGNDTNPYQLAFAYSSYVSAINGGAILEMKLPDAKPLSDLEPEKTNSYEAGFELRMFKNRFSVDFTYYNSNTINQILSINTPVSSGYMSKIINAGKMKSSGYELMLNGTPIQTKDWQWDVTLNWGANRSECVELNEDIKRYTLGSIRIGSVVVEEGRKFGDIVANKAFKRDSQGNILIDDNGFPLTTTDEIIGNMLPKWTGSVGTTIRWKDVSLSALVDVRYGGNFISMTDNYATSSGNSKKSLEGRDGMVVKGIVESTGLENSKQITAEEYYSNIGQSSGVAEAFMYDGTYVKMRELSLGWSLPQLWLSKTPLKSVRISAVGRDLFYFYKDAPVNPEGAFSREDYAQAFEMASIPPTRSFGFSLNVKF